MKKPKFDSYGAVEVWMDFMPSHISKSAPILGQAPRMLWQQLHLEEENAVVLSKTMEIIQRVSWGATCPHISREITFVPRNDWTPKLTVAYCWTSKQLVVKPDKSKF